MYSTGFMYLPLLVMQGPVHVATVITEWLKTSFDCCITACRLDQNCLLALAENYARKRASESPTLTLLIMEGLLRIFYLYGAGAGGGRGREKLAGLKLIYNPPRVVKDAGLATVSLELPYDSTAALSKGGSLMKTLQDILHENVHLKLSVRSLITFACRSEFFIYPSSL